jgi:hypothetical protein
MVASREETVMTWQIAGTYFENCSCDMVCPCSTSGLTVAADTDRCTVVLAFHIDSGDSDGLDLSGLNVCMVADAPKMMTDGNWKAALLTDDGASAEQTEAINAIFGGTVGGPLGDLAPLIGEMVGGGPAAIDYADDGFHHRVTIGDLVDIAVEDFVSPLDPTGKGIRVSGVGFPADTLAAGTATKAAVNAYGMSWDTTGKNSFSAPFAWSA